MDGVSDHPFRHIQKKYGRPSVVYTEFTSVEGVCHGAERLLDDFLFDETQRPVIAQIYGTTPDYFRQTAIVLCELGFDGIDINMGCPAKNVAHSGAGAALIRTPELAAQLIQAVKQGIKEWQQGAQKESSPDITESIWQQVQARHQLLPEVYQNTRHIPVSVKTRIGFGEKITLEWIGFLLNQDLEAIALHGRTLSQQYSGLADWEEIGKAAKLAHQHDTLLLGNGDVKTMAEALEKVDCYGVDGVLIGRGAMGNPKVFLRTTDAAPDTTTASNFEIALEHTRLYEQTYGKTEKYHFLPMRKHLGWYVKDIPNASQIRIELFRTESSDGVKAIFDKYHLL